MVAKSKRMSLAKVEQEKAARRTRRQERHDRVQQLSQDGYSDRAITRQLNMSIRTVRHYIKAEHLPHYPSGRVRHSTLTPWLPYLEQRW